MRRSLFVLIAIVVALPVAGLLASNGNPNVDHAVVHQDDAKGVTASDEEVVFNTNSLKYHCGTCTWAKRCTANCIKIKKSDAIARGGAACKVCNGSCR